MSFIKLDASILIMELNRLLLRMGADDNGGKQYRESAEEPGIRHSYRHLQRFIDQHRSSSKRGLAEVAALAGCRAATKESPGRVSPRMGLQCTADPNCTPNYFGYGMTTTQ